MNHRASSARTLRILGKQEGTVLGVRHGWLPLKFERIMSMKVKRNLSGRRSSKPVRHPKAGFTLVELVYVAIIIGVLAVLIAPRLNVSRLRMNSAVQEVATELMAAQRNAVLRGHDVVVAIDEGASWFRIHLDANNDGMIQNGEDTRVSQLGDGVTFGRAGAPPLTPSTQMVTFQQTQGSLKALTFHRNGSASEAGVIYLTHELVNDPYDDRAVEIVRSTAKVKCWNHTNGTWREAC
jgi:prepilin-type N-terminal cleavage/methylation domain-containing protein